MTLAFPTVTPVDWRAQVDKDLAGASFDRTLVHRTAAGISILPLYTGLPDAGALAVDCGGVPFRICVRHETGDAVAALDEDLDGGADAVWLSRSPSPSEDERLGRVDPTRTFVVLDVDGASPAAAIEAIGRRATPEDAPAFALTMDPYALVARGELSLADTESHLASLTEAARSVSARFPRSSVAMASALPYHDAGADDADEVAFALATGVAYLGALLRGGLTPDAAARQIALQVAVGRDTFMEVCKLRALRVCWQKVLLASGARGERTRVHAVCSSRTLTARDPWVNMLRVTTQVFAAVLGGADLVTPAAFDQSLGPPSALGRRVARNTGLVLREESHLGRVTDPAGGSYYLETVTDALAREAWTRFQGIEREGGVAAAWTDDRLRQRLEAAWRVQLEQVSKRRIAILGVSEFANLDEISPVAPRDPFGNERSRSEAAIPVHRDAEMFERLRDRADAASAAPEATLVALGPFAESRPRVGFATGFFGAGGIRAREQTDDRSPRIACLCGSDERYAAEAAESARELKAKGVQRVLLAGRPGALEASLREAGVDGFLFVGCDVAATLSELLQAFDVPA